MKCALRYGKEKAMNSIKLWLCAVWAMLLSVFAVPAFALDTAITTAVTTTFAALLADAVILSGLVIPAIVGILSLTVVIKLVKMFGHKIG